MRYRNRKPEPRTMYLKYTGPCHCCGAEIKAGELATYYPAGSVGNATAYIKHVENIQGDSTRCSAEIARKRENQAVNDYAGDGLDTRYEDQCADICGR